MVSSSREQECMVVSFTQELLSGPVGTAVSSITDVQSNAIQYSTLDITSIEEIILLETVCEFGRNSKIIWAEI